MVDPRVYAARAAIAAAIPEEEETQTHHLAEHVAAPVLELHLLEPHQHV